MIARFLSGAAVAVLLAAASPVSAQLPAPPPVEAYGQLPALAQVRLSGSGDKLAFIQQVGEERRLVVQTLDAKPLGAVRLGAQNVVAVQWVGDNHVVVTVRDTRATPGITGDERARDWYTAQIYNVSTRQFATVLSRMTGTGRVGGTSRTGGSMGLNVLSSFPEVRLIDGEWALFANGLIQGEGAARFRIDLDTGAGAYVRDAAGAITDENGVPIAEDVWDVEDKIWILNARDGVKRRQIVNYKGALTGGVEDTPQLHGVGRTPGTVLVTMPEGEFGQLYEYSLADGSRKRLSFGKDYFGEISPMYQGSTGKLLGFSFTGKDRPQFLWTDDVAGQTYESIKAGFADADVTISSASPDYKKVVVLTEGPNDPGTYRFVDMAARKAVPISSQYPGVPGSAVAEKTWISYKASDGLEIYAYLTLPRGRDPKNLPLVVLPHGGPQARDDASFDWWSQAIASRGYAVLQPQFRGSDGFGKAFVEMGYGQWGKKMQTDLSDGVRHLVAQGVVDPKRVCINGWSYGGYAAMAGPTLDPGVYRCSIAGAGVSDMRRMLLWVKEQAGGQRDAPALRYWTRYMQADRVNDRDLDAIAPALHADKVDGPMLLLHGDLDTVVPLEQSRYMAEALRKAGKPHEFVVLKGEDHNISRGRTRMQMLTATLDWLAKHNPAD